MRSTIVPAQVTTVEDRIVGNLGVSQVLLLVSPLFLLFTFRLLLPPFGHLTSLKVTIWIAISSLLALSALRIRGTIVLFHATSIVRYMQRPTYYLFDKHSSAGRTQYTGPEALIEDARPVVSETVQRTLLLNTAEVANLERLLANPAANVSFDFTKGGLRVHLTEIKEEG